VKPKPKRKRKTDNSELPEPPEPVRKKDKPRKKFFEEKAEENSTDGKQELKHTI
jgi:hypothetical protein